MHRQTTQLSKRAPGRAQRFVRTLERRGIVLTYGLHDRVLSNRASRRRFAVERPVLDELQQRLVRELGADGCATVPLDALLADQPLVSDVLAQGDAFIADTEGQLALEAAGAASELRRRAGKEFVVRAHSFESVRLGLDDPWLRVCLSSRLLDVANAYLQMWSKLSYVDLWYTAPQGADAARSASQLWHLDFDDRHLLKAFLYLVDVDERSGPFEYVPGSQPGGRYEDSWRWLPMGTTRVAEDAVLSRAGRDGVRTMTGARGTVILCNTSGLHRGGFSTANPRVLATATYCSPASLAALSLRNVRVTDTARETLSGAALYAVT